MEDKKQETISGNDAAVKKNPDASAKQDAPETENGAGAEKAPDAAKGAADPKPESKEDATKTENTKEASPDAAEEDSASEEGAADARSGDETGKTPNDTASGKKEKTSFKSRREKKELAKKDEQIAELTDRVRRTMAEFDNYRKRTEKEKAQMYGMGVRDVIEKLLPVIDNFERGIAQIPEDEKESPVAAGFEAIYKQFTGLLEQLGITPIEAVGAEFDPNLHNAVMHVEDEDAGENTIVEEFQRGYLYKEQVVRHSMVKVAN